LLASCVPAEESNDRIKRYDPEDSIMGEIQERGAMRIGIPSDYPPFAIVEDGAEPEGFVVDMGTLIAEALGVEAEFVAVPSTELLDLVEVDRNSEPLAADPADIVFPMLPISEQLVQSYTFTDPFWVGHTRELEGPPAPEREVMVAPARDVELLHVAYENPGLKITGEQQSTEGYGAAVRTGAVTFATLASQVINEADAEGDWSAFYERWLAKYFADPAPDDIPIMTVEEAAALYPSDLD
jgi:ABC-type amino acid transport substrate-binding protein